MESDISLIQSNPVQWESCHWSLSVWNWWASADEQDGDVTQPSLVTVGKQLLKRPLGELNWIVCCVLRRWLTATQPLRHSPGSKSALRIADGARCVLIICGKHGESKQWDVRVLPSWASVFIYGVVVTANCVGACRPSKPKCSNCFVGTLETEIDQSSSPPLTACKWPLTFQLHTITRVCNMPVCGLAYGGRVLGWKI